MYRKLVIAILRLCDSSYSLLAQNAIKDSLLRVANANQLDSPTVSAFLNLGSIYKSEQDFTKSGNYYFKALNLEESRVDI